MAEDINGCRITFGAYDKVFPLPAIERRRLADRDAEFAALQAHLQELAGLAKTSARIAEAKDAVIEAAKAVRRNEIAQTVAALRTPDRGGIKPEVREIELEGERLRRIETKAVDALIKAEGE